jgi:multisubunit Na+/H+ antiporter MnhF subunit
MNGWLVAVVVLLALMGALGIFCALADAVDGLVALEVAGIQATLALLLLAEGMHRQPFADLALVFAVMSFIGTLAFAFALERRV